MKLFSITELYSLSRDRPIETPILSDVVNLISRHPSLTAKSLARTLGVDRRELSGAVHLLTGKGLNNFLTEWHMLTALDLLRTTDYDFLTIAVMSGYSRAKNLAVAMDRKLGMTPFEYRHGYRRGVERPVKTCN